MTFADSVSLTTMRAARLHGRGDVRIEEVARPAPPARGHVELEVLGAAVCGTDVSEFRDGPSLVGGVDQRLPVTIGHEFVGRVSRRGPGTVKFRVGDRVVCGAGVSCGTCDRCADGRTNLCAAYYTHGLQAPGGLAEAVVVPASICVVLPDNVPTQRAVLAQPLAVATHAVRRADMHAARLRPSSALAGSAPSSLQQPPAAQAR